jgi:FixJ family two-component response regulator
VLDVQIPGVSGLQIQAFLRGQLSPLPVLFLSADAGHETVVRAMKAGALQFLRKPCDEELLWETLQDAVAFDAQHRAKLAELERIRRTFDLLDSKEQAVVHLLLEHDSTHDIAKSLDVSVRTVELRRSRILQKLGLRSWRQLLHFAFKVAFVESLATDSALLLEPSHSLRFLGPPTNPSPPRNRNP